MALWEKIARDGGFIENPSMRDYLLPGAKDVPTEITTLFVENTDDTGPFGAKGVAEASLIPVPAAVAAALHDAVGIRLNSMPMEAEKIVETLNAKTRTKT
jgi:CO/xanthine dehydrogenase Mo-binding subunit